jgi:hypothetical protein
MWADAVNGAKASRTAAAKQMSILFIVYPLSLVVSCFRFRFSGFTGPALQSWIKNCPDFAAIYQ